MIEITKPARTITEWWDRRYAQEHFVVGVLFGFLIAALIGAPIVALLATRGSEAAQEVISSQSHKGTLLTPLE